VRGLGFEWIRLSGLRSLWKQNHGCVRVLDATDGIRFGKQDSMVRCAFHCCAKSAGDGGDRSVLRCFLTGAESRPLARRPLVGMGVSLVYLVWITRMARPLGKGKMAELTQKEPVTFGM
jgi:hypothetical protein